MTTDYLSVERVAPYLLAPGIGGTMTAGMTDRLAAALAERYHVERQLGVGGMATVYLAHDLRHDRDVAIKALDPELAASLGAERFLAEIRTTARLQHPHVLPLLDSGEAAGTLYYVMPFVRGETLRERLARERRLPVSEVVHIAGEVAEGLQHAHDAGIVHRDVKPENIMLTGGHALLADFGIARGSGTGAAAHLTASGVIVGTATYMSPEQAAGERDIGPATDQYALACVVFEALAGEPPFSGPTVQAVLAKRLAVTPVPLRVLRPTVPAPVEAAVARALCRDPADRFPDMLDFARALGSAEARTEKRLADEPSIAVLPFANLSADAENEYFSDGITEDIIAQLSKVAALKVISRTSVMRFKRTTLGLREIGESLGVGAVLEGTVRRSGDRLRITAQLIDARTDAHLWAETFDRKLTDVFEIQSEVSQSIAMAMKARLTPEEHARVARVAPANLEAYNETLLGRQALNRWFEADFHRSIAHFDRAIAIDPAYAPAHSGRGIAYGTLSLGYWTIPPGTYHSEAQGSLDRALTLDPQHGEALAFRAYLHVQYDYDWEAAEVLVQRALTGDPNSASVHDACGNLLCAQGRHVESRSQYDRAVELDPLSNLILLNAALCAQRARDLARADAWCVRNIELNPELPAAYHIRAGILAADGRRAEALASVRRAQAIYGPEGKALADVAVAPALAAMGEHDEARHILERCERLRQTQNVWPMGLAMAYAQLGEADRALTHLEDAHERHDFWIIWLKVQPELDPLRGEPRFQRLLRKVRLA